MVYQLYKIDHYSFRRPMYAVLSTNAWYWAIPMTNRAKCLQKMKELGLKNTHQWINQYDLITINQFNDLNKSVIEMHGEPKLECFSIKKEESE